MGTMGMVGGVSFTDYLQLLNFWRGPKPQPRFRHQLLTNIKDFLFRSEMTQGEISILLSEIRRNTFIKSTSIFQRVDELPTTILDTILMYLKSDQITNGIRRRFINYMRILVVDLEMSDDELKSLQYKILQVDDKLRPEQKILTNAARILKKPRVTIFNVEMFVSQRDDWETTNPLLYFTYNFMLDHALQSVNMQIIRDAFSQQQLTDEDFDLDRVLYNQFYWTRKQLFQEDLLDDGIVKVVTKLVEIFGKSKISTPFHEDEEYFDLILDDCDGVKWTNKARKAVLWTLSGIFDKIKTADEFSDENVQRLKEIVNDFDRPVQSDIKLDVIELFVIGRHLRRRLEPSQISSMLTLIRCLTDEKYKFQTNKYPSDLEPPIEFEDFYPRNNSRLEFIANQVFEDELVESLKKTN